MGRLRLHPEVMLEIGRGSLLFVMVYLYWRSGNHELRTYGWLSDTTRQADLWTTWVSRGPGLLIGCVDTCEALDLALACFPVASTGQYWLVKNGISLSVIKYIIHKKWQYNPYNKCKQSTRLDFFQMAHTGSICSHTCFECLSDLYCPSKGPRPFHLKCVELLYMLGLLE